MVQELKNPPPGAQGPGQPGRRGQNDRWGDIYTNMPVRKMIALYDYDPQVLSPNVDAEVIYFQPSYEPFSFYPQLITLLLTL